MFTKYMFLNYLEMNIIDTMHTALLPIFLDDSASYFTVIEVEPRLGKENLLLPLSGTDKIYNIELEKKVIDIIRYNQEQNSWAMEKKRILDNRPVHLI